jgi:hypothetical protein
MLLNTKLSEVFLKSIGVGFYLTGVFSILLFFTGFDKSDDNSQADRKTDLPTYLPTTRLKNETKTNKPAIQEWLDKNPVNQSMTTSRKTNNTSDVMASVNI